MRWESLQDARHPDLLHVGFSRADCSACPVRLRCPRSKAQARALTLRPRAGIEGTISQAVRVFDLRQARYRGLAKTHLQHVATAVAINLDRLDHWFAGLPRIRTKPLRLATLASVN